ncbi:MAG: 3-isopropylmalate dehydratase large subunit [Chloroflexota bacterium]
MGQTIAEKIFSKRVGHPVRAGEIVIAPVDLAFCHDASRPQGPQLFREMGGERLFDPAKVLLFLDHSPTAPDQTNATVHNQIREFARQQGVRLYELGDGICHQLVPEKGHALPGDLIVGMDSHSCTQGALNALATGIGASDMAVVLKTGKLWFKVPQTLRFVVEGDLPSGVYSKDLILYLIGTVGAEGANYMAAEFVGPTISKLSMEARLTISNMAIEMGAKFGLMEADDTTREWLRGRTDRPFEDYASDPDAFVFREHHIDASQLEPQVAAPHSPANVSPVRELAATPVHQGVIGTCTNGRIEDLRIAATVLRGHRPAPGVRLFVTPASRDIYRQAVREGLIDLFLGAGAVIGTPGCSGCNGSAALGIPADGENTISSANRNFKGRTGNNRSFIYLASPATVTASVIEGRIADPRKYLQPR